MAVTGMARLEVVAVVVAIAGCGGSDLLEPGDSVVLTLDELDFTTARTAWEHELTELQFQEASSAAEPQNGQYLFTDNGVVWETVGIDSPGGASVRGVSASGEAGRNFLVLCRLEPDGDLVADDDVDPALCASDCACDPALTLDSEGEWICFFGVSPFSTSCYALEPLGGQLTVQVE